MPELSRRPGLAGVERTADAAEFGQRLLAQLSEVTFSDGGRLVAAQAAEDLDAARVVGAAAGRVGQDDAARMAREEPGIGQHHATAEAAAHHHGLDQPECVAQAPQIIGPGRQVPELGRAGVAAAVPALVVVDNLEVAGERRQPGLHVDVVKARAAMHGHESRAFDHGAPVGQDGRPGDVEPDAHVT